MVVLAVGAAGSPWMQPAKGGGGDGGGSKETSAQTAKMNVMSQVTFVLVMVGGDGGGGVSNASESVCVHASTDFLRWRRVM